MINKFLLASAFALMAATGNAVAQTNGGSLTGGTVETGGGNSGVSADGTPYSGPSDGKTLGRSASDVGEKSSPGSGQPSADCTRGLKGATNKAAAEASTSVNGSCPE
jgi:hypothetical protein